MIVSLYFFICRLTDPQAAVYKIRFSKRTDGGENASPSSRGLGHGPFTPVTGVRLPVGTPILSIRYISSNFAFLFGGPFGRAGFLCLRSTARQLKLSPLSYRKDWRVFFCLFTSISSFFIRLLRVFELIPSLAPAPSGP